jgi:hypothetical protein
MSAIAAASPASAGVTLNGDGSFSTTGTGGGTVVITMDGITDGPTLIQGLTAQLTLTFKNVSTDGKTYAFYYSLFNSSSGQVTGSRVSSFGFDTNPNVSGGKVTGAFDVLHLGDAYPVIKDPEVCVFDPNNPKGGVCTGSGGGINIGDKGEGMLYLTFASVPTGNSITLSNFVDRYQSITGVKIGGKYVTSAVGQETNIVALPEPATWALMLIGFGGMGVALRRRRRSPNEPLKAA